MKGYTVVWLNTKEYLKYLAGKSYNAVNKMTGANKIQVIIPSTDIESMLEGKGVGFTSFTVKSK